MTHNQIYVPYVPLQWVHLNQPGIKTRTTMTDKKDYRIRMIATSTESTAERHGQHRHGPVIYALLTNQSNLNEPGDDVIMTYDHETGGWLALDDPRDYLNG